ncbi:DUF2783 domain-containing protein [Phreatobacter cathodiphilus]|uniref:DUF2783 domain-containing protein n=1 Tax=Phreatobacter cathodiphilus TaxID=1868589 RepID=UPI002481EC7E|nr:DUF2783 domain-containing protein [Phreatobacter cathodiphilus]
MGRADESESISQPPESEREHQPATGLALASRLADPDAAYRLLAAAQRGLSEAEAAAFQARLALILANQVGDQAVLAEAVELARVTG